MKNLQLFILGFRNARAFNAYVAEDESVEDDDTPLSKFAADQGEIWIDHDFMEMEFCGSKDAVREELGTGSYGESYAEAARLALDNAALPDGANAYIVLFEESQVDEPKSVNGDGYWSRYIGSFPYEGSLKFSWEK